MSKTALWFVQVFNFWSWISPVLNISDDGNFGTLKIKSKELRLSLVCIKLGGSIYYLVTYGFWLGAPEKEKTVFSKGYKFFLSSKAI